MMKLLQVTFVNGETIEGVSNADPNIQIELTVSH